MDASTSDYHHGDQDPAAQVASYRSFTNLTKWFSLHLAVLILVLALWFCVGLSFFGGLIPGLIVMALGIWLLRSKANPNP